MTDISRLNHLGQAIGTRGLDSLGDKVVMEALVLLFGAVEAGLLLIGPEGVDLVNEPALRILGKSREEVIGQKVETLLEPPPDLAPPGAARLLMGRVKAPSGPGPLLRGAAYGLNQGAQIWVLKSGESLFELGSLAAGMAHNLSKPLGVIRSTGEMVGLALKDAISKEPSLADSLEAWPFPIIEACERITEHVDHISLEITQLLAKLRGEASHERKPLDLNEILRRELQFLENDLFFKKDVRQVLSFAPDLPPIQGLYSDFSQSFRNLLSNAVKAMRESPERVLNVFTAVVGEEVVIRVADTGEGIPPEVKDHIFEPFVTSGGPDADSAGLGLYSVSQLLQPYGVRFEVESKPGRTVFSICLPALKKS